jgi:hypothetical protein
VYHKVKKYVPNHANGRVFSNQIVDLKRYILEGCGTYVQAILPTMFQQGFSWASPQLLAVRDSAVRGAIGRAQDELLDGCRIRCPPVML